MKKCTSCGNEKSPDHFFVRRASRDGLSPVCKVCDVAHRKARRDADPQREFEYQLAWRTANAERKKATDRRLHLKNREVNLIKSKAYHAAHKAKMNAQARAWGEAHAEEIRAFRKAQRQGPEGDAIRARRRRHYAENKARYVANARRRERHIARATPPWADLERIAWFYAERERMSAESDTVHHVDHIIPLRGKWVWGLHVDYNLQIIPANENLSKSNFIRDAA